MNTLVIDMSKWRCGANGPYALGEGDTALLNQQGYMCCLGQFTPQLNPSTTQEEILYSITPSDIKKEIQLLTSVNPFRDNVEVPHNNSAFSQDAMKINDNQHTTPDEKISLLADLLLEYKYELEVIDLVV